MLLTIKRNDEVVNTFEDAGMITESFLSNLWAYCQKYQTVKRMQKKVTGSGIIVTFELNENIEGTKNLKYIYELPEYWGRLDSYKMLQAIKKEI